MRDETRSIEQLGLGAFCHVGLAAKVNEDGISQGSFSRPY